MKNYQTKQKSQQVCEASPRKSILSFPSPAFAEDKLQRESSVLPKNLSVVLHWIPAFAGMTIVIFVVSIANAQMQSSNYKLESDSLNFGGGRATSASYNIEDTLGESATGVSSSTNYTMRAGYQQMQGSTISVVPASNVTMSPAIGGVTGGTANGQASFTVITDNPAGYMATITASSSPALASAEVADSFADYVPVGAVPDFTFTNAPTASSFAFTPEGDDIAQRYKNNGASVCGIGSSDAVDSCWDGLSTSDKTFLNRTSSNQPLGTLSRIKFRAASGSSHIQKDGVYTATTTITVTAL